MFGSHIPKMSIALQAARCCLSACLILDDISIVLPVGLKTTLARRAKYIDMTFPKCAGDPCHSGIQTRDEISFLGHINKLIRGCEQACILLSRVAASKCFVHVERWSSYPGMRHTIDSI